MSGLDAKMLAIVLGLGADRLIELNARAQRPQDEDAVQKCMDICDSTGLYSVDDLAFRAIKMQKDVEAVVRAPTGPHLRLVVMIPHAPSVDDFLGVARAKK